VRRLLLGIILLGLTAAVTSPAAAQVAIGAKGGINFSDFSATDNGVAVEPPFESRTGLLLGASVGVSVTPWLALQLEGRYSQEGTQQEEMGVNVLLRLSYVDVPLIAKFIIPTKGGPVSPYLYAGGIVGFEVACGLHAEVPALDLAMDLDCEEEGVDRKKTDYGLVFGAGTDVRLGPGAFTLDLEYAVGLRNLSTEAGSEAHSRVFSVAAGYRVFFGVS
jgi:opacity protein-like surface antigen